MLSPCDLLDWKERPEFVTGCSFANMAASWVKSETGPGTGGQGEIEERGRPLQIGRQWV